MQLLKITVMDANRNDKVVSTILSVNCFNSIWYCGDCYTQLSFSSLRHSFSSLRHSCSKKFLWRLNPTHTMWTFHLHKNFFEQLWQLYASNSLHNTKTSRKELKIILWRLLRQHISRSATSYLRVLIFFASIKTTTEEAQMVTNLMFPLK